MAFFRQKEVIGEGIIVGLRQLTPLDYQALSALLGDEKDDPQTYNTYLTAMSIVWAESPKQDLTPEEFLIKNPVKPENWIEIEDVSAKKLKDGSYPKKKILDPDRPYNWILDKTKCVRKMYAPLTYLRDEQSMQKDINNLLERQNMSIGDFTIVTLASIRLNEPNPELLGK